MNQADAFLDETEWVEPEWVLAHLDHPDIRLIECGSDSSSYAEGHLPGAGHLDWNTDLLFGETVDEGDALYFSYLCLQRKIHQETICILYGSAADDLALKALRIFQRFGHPRLKILRGGKEGWIYRGFSLNLERNPEKRGQDRTPAGIASVRCYSHEW